MAAENIYDCVASNLLCTETKSLCFDDLDSLTISQQNIETNSKDLSFNNGIRSEPLIDLPSLSEESFGFMVQREMEFLPKDEYLERLRSGDLDLSVRKEALDWIWKVGDPNFVFEGKTIQRMELLVLSTLKWRMQAYTPCTFIDYFVRKMNGDQIPSRPLISRSMQLILSTIRGIDFLEFSSSEIAAAVAISVSGEIHAIDIDKKMPFFFIHLDKGRVLKCVELIQDLPTATIVTTTTASLVPQSPIGVLEAEACLSYKSGDERTVGSCTTSSHTSPNTKRRKLDTSSLEEGTTEKL